jgi:hypothetical protein
MFTTVPTRSPEISPKSILKMITQTIIHESKVRTCSAIMKFIPMMQPFLAAYESVQQTGLEIRMMAPRCKIV